MPATYLSFDFGTNEEAAQKARHKLEGWKQAFRLDKRLLYKFDRGDAAGVETPAKAPEEKPVGKGKSGSKDKVKAKGKAAERADSRAETKSESQPESSAAGPVKLLVRLYFSDHEKLSEQRWIERIPNDEHFRAAAPKVIRLCDTVYASASERFDALD